MPPSRPCSTEKRPFSVVTRSSRASSSAFRRSPLPLSETIVSRPPALDLADDDGDPRRRPAQDRLVERLADDLVEADLLLLAEPLGRRDVDVDLEAVLEPQLLGELLHGGDDPLVAQHDRLDVEREVAERADRVAVLLEGGAHDLARIAGPVLADRLHGRVEHERDPREVLHRPVVEEERQPPPLVLLRRDQPVGELGALVLADPGVREQARIVELDVLVAPPLADDRGRATRRRAARPARPARG